MPPILLFNISAENYCFLRKTAPAPILEIPLVTYILRLTGEIYMFYYHVS